MILGDSVVDLNISNQVQTPPGLGWNFTVLPDSPLVESTASYNFAVFDCNGDHIPDILRKGATEIQVGAGDGNGSFTLTTYPRHTRAVAYGDLNNDRIMVP